MFTLVLAEGTSAVAPQVLVRRLANLTALARQGGHTPIAPQLSALTADLLAPRSEPGLLDDEDISRLEHSAERIWVIGASDRAEPQPPRAAYISKKVVLPWSGWHARLVEVGLGHLDEFNAARPRLDRWPGDGDPASTTIDELARTLRLRWPLMGLDVTIGGIESKADPLFTVLATLFRASWNQIRADLPEVGAAADAMDPRMLADVIRMGLTAGAAQASAKADLQERLDAAGLHFIELPDDLST